MSDQARNYIMKKHDYHNARHWEEHVEKLFDPTEVISRFDSAEDTDLWFPGFYLELKEKNQRYTKRWHLLDGVPEKDLFIMDELTVRRSAKHYPEVFYLIRDNIEHRLFFAPIWEMISCERVRLNRKRKGKWIIDMTVFQQIEHETEVKKLAVHALASVEWKRSDVASHKPVPEVS